MATAPITPGSFSQTQTQSLFAKKNDDQVVNFAPKQRLPELSANEENNSAAAAVDAAQPKQVVNTSGQVIGTTINTTA